ncbi:MAG: hypothetical protein Q9166_003505 [cf. Caloplaca sp. 2 TL-2023]
MLFPRSLYSDPPPAKNSVANHPTLLVSWWCTGFALAIILVRISGRYIRTERLFREDIVMVCSLIPLLARMALVHVIMVFGTNNTKLDGLTAQDIHHREIGSRLVLASRIMYAAFLWIAKFTVSEFLKRLTSQVWRQAYENVLQFIRWFLAVTFAAVVIATLAECQPFDHYWQVVPDPGAKCRQGYAQLITMGTSDVITDLLLVAFPIPIVLKSHMAAKRKVSLILLFSLSLILIAITIYRVVEVVHRQSDQQFRSLVASLEILAAAAVSNALVLGSFVRDRGVKKQRYRFNSVGGNSSLDRAGTGPRPRALTAQTWGSDADLAEELGMRMAPDLERQQIAPARPRPAPLALPPASHAKVLTPGIIQADYKSLGSGSARSGGSDTRNVPYPNGDADPSPSEIEVVTPRRTSFFDVGGLLDYGGAGPARLPRPEQTIPEITPAPLPSTGHRRSSNVFLTDHDGVALPQLRQTPTTVRNFSRPTSPTQRMARISQPFSFSPPRVGSQDQSTKVPETQIPEQNPGLTSSSFRDVGGLLD